MKEQTEQKNTFLFTVDQQNAMDSLGAQKNTMDLSAWRDAMAEMMFEFVMPKLGYRNSDPSIAENQRINVPLSDALTRFWQYMGSFQPEKGVPFSHFAQAALKKMYKKNSNEEKTHYPMIPLESETKEGDVIDIPVPAPENRNIDLLARNQALTAMILRFSTLVPRKYSESRQRWYQMWYSERSVPYLQWGGPVYNERDTAAAMDFDYLDFFLEQDFQCEENRNVAGIRSSRPYKSIYCECADKYAPVGWKNNGWLDAAIPRQYAATWGSWDGTYPSDTTVSNSRQQYREDCMKLLEE